MMNFLLSLISKSHATHLWKCCLFLCLLCPFSLSAQTVRIKGQVQDKEGESLPLANVLILPDSAMVPTDIDGNFLARVKRGTKKIRITYTGYQVLEYSFKVDSDTTLRISLTPAFGQLQEVTITANRYSQQDLVQTTRTGTHTLTKRDIEAIPVLGGESDVIKTLQLLPGTVRGVEGSSDLFVRGGAADQNLVLLDGAPIYNTSHLFGFLSVFNPDILEKVEAINGGFPAEYGGRLSSILNITSNNTIADRTRISGDVGILASRLYLEQPLIKNKASIWVAGRRTYIDQVVKSVKSIEEELPYFFYDLNGKVLFKTSKYDQFDFSHYMGDDILDLFRDANNDGSGLTTTYISGNSSQSLQWKRRHPREWNMDMALTRTAFQYKIRNAFEENELKAFSNIEDYGAKVSFEKDSAWMNAHVKVGLEWTRHEVSPNVINSTGNFAAILESSTSGGKIANELAAHVQQEWQLGRRTLINAGLRGSMALVEDRQYFIPEPRLSLRYSMGDNQSVKVSYSRMAQYMHRISNSAISTPTDIWYPVTDSIRPQTAHQFSAAWQMFFPKSKVFISTEGYYKSMQHLIGYEEGTNLFFNADFASKLIQGKGRAYGTEFLVRKEAGKFTGWLSYTLSWSWRQYNEIALGEWFPSRYDRRHNGAVVMQYALSKRWSASAVWEFISGSRFTPVIGQYVVPAPTLTGVDLIPVFSDINAVKLADTHRLDLGIKYASKQSRRFRWHIHAGVNNVYNRASPIGIFIEQDENDGSLRYTQPGLFGLIPFLNLGFKI